MVRIVETTGTFDGAAQDLAGRVTLRLLQELREQPEVIGRLATQAHQVLREAQVLGGAAHASASQAALVGLTQPEAGLLPQLAAIEQAYQQAAACYEHAMAPNSGNAQLARHLQHALEQRDQAQRLCTLLATT
jgi:hypothetical protein